MESPEHSYALPGPSSQSLQYPSQTSSIYHYGNVNQSVDPDFSYPLSLLNGHGPPSRQSAKVNGVQLRSYHQNAVVEGKGSKHQKSRALSPSHPHVSQMHPIPSQPASHSSTPYSSTASDGSKVVDYSTHRGDSPTEDLSVKSPLTITQTQGTQSLNSPSPPRGDHLSLLQPNHDSLRNFPPPSVPPHQEWIISLHRPRNPLDAFSIIISPTANPPPHIVSGAVSLPTSACSSEGSLDDLKSTRLSMVEERAAGYALPSYLNFHPVATAQTTPARSITSGTLIPSSPSSTNASLTVSSPTLSLSTQTDASVFSPSSPSHMPSPLMKEQNGITPATEAVHAAELPVRKSWASLLRTSGNPSSSSNTLPTSTVVGFSVPAQRSLDSTRLASVQPTKKADLILLLSAGPSGSSGALQIRPRGLVNSGNICFANSVLQVLVYCPPFNRLFTELDKYIFGPSINAQKSESRTPLVEATVQFLKEFKPKPPSGSRSQDDADGDDWMDSFLPTYVYDAMKEKKRFDNMRGGHQEDAEEFLGFFLDTLEEELLSMVAAVVSGSVLEPPVSIISDEQTRENTQDDDWVEVGKRNKLVATRSTKTVESPITRIFNGKFRSTLKVPGQRDSVLVEDWRALQLDIQREQVHTIEDALHCISQPQPVQVASVTKGGAIVDASQQVFVDSLPSILALHLKRFLYDTRTQGVVKIGKQVAFGPELEIPTDAISPARRTAHPIKYKLFAVVYHHGLSAGGGHYTLDVLHPNRNADSNAKPREGWIRIDDELVSDLRMEDVFGTDPEDRCAYLLFYKRVGGGHVRL